MRPLELYEKAGDELSAAKVRVNRIDLFGIFLVMRKPSETVMSAEKVFTRFGEKQMLARTLNNLGAVFFGLDRISRMACDIEEASKFLEEIR